MDGYVTIGTKLDTSDFDAEIKYVESQLKEIEYKIKQADLGFDVGDTQKLEFQYSKLTKKLDTLKRKQQEFNKMDLKKAQKSIESIGKSTSNVISKVVRWALGIFAIESAYGFVRQAMSTLSQYNEQIATDTQYIQYAIATTLQPLIENMISLVYKLLQYVNYIAMSWFNVNLFANASTDSFNKAAKASEKMKKSLAGFDEMNVLNDNGTVGSLGGISPDVDLSKIQGEIPEWMEWIVEHKDEMIAALTGIATSLGLIFLGLSPLIGLGIGIALGGILYTIMKIKEFLDDPTFTYLTGVLEGIAVSVMGVAIAFGAWAIALGAAIAIMVIEVTKNFDKIKKIISDVGTWLETDFLEKLRHLFGPVGDIIFVPIQGAFMRFQSLFEDIYGGIKKIIDGIVKLFRGDLKGGLSSIMSGLASILVAPFNALISGLNAMIKGINRIKVKVPKWVPNYGGESIGFNIPSIPKIKLAVGGIVNMPGRGVPVGGAITGEAGAEGVIPLTDEQAMDMLGQSIGRHITINFTNVTRLNSREIARETKRVNQENSFMTNS